MKAIASIFLAAAFIVGSAHAAPPIKMMDGSAESFTAPTFQGQPMPPKYPPALFRQGIGGVTVVRIDLDASGRVQQVFVQESSGQKALDDSSVFAAKRWSFRPALNAEGKPVSSSITVPLTFTAAGG